DRNRIKRLGREAWRLQKEELYNHLRSESRQLAVFLIYTDKKIADFSTLKDKISVILKKLQTSV
ncbi:ribonuclease P protein component, partial [Chitinophaga sp.]|uniref:ribonuclease P protein component n=1 Tax=Chitinophaga sp. TaxID=1869181 RepID=UPI002C96A221